MQKYLKFNNIILIFLIIQPFFDLVYFYGNISTLIRIIISIIFFVYTIIKFKDKKAIMFFSIYFLIILGYFILHNINCLNFESLVPGNFNYNTVEEILYFLKMCIPLLLIYVVYKNILTEKNINTGYKIIIVLISGSIIITNILGVSLATYQNTTIEANFISWFFGAYNHYSYMELASKGFFSFTNHIVAILLLMIPIIFSILEKNFSKKNICIFIILLLSMIMLGNKISVFGSFMVVISLVFIYLFFSIIKKQLKINKNLIIMFIILIFTYIPLMYMSPAYNRIITREGTIAKGEEETSGEKIVIEPNNKIEYIKDNYISKKILKQFILKSYPYRYDSDFWINILNEPMYKRIDYRFIEISMMQRVIEINDNFNDKLVGIGYSRQMNIFNVEKDYLNQYYSLGIIGLIIFIGPYLVLFSYSIYITIKDKFTFKNIMLLFSISLILIAAYFGGNLFNSLSVMIPFSYVYGILLSSLKNDKML